MNPNAIGYVRVVPPPSRFGDLEIADDIEFQRREWTFERLTWAAILVLVLAAALGLFGHGPVSWTSSSSSDGALEVSYERFGRRGGSQTLVVTADAAAADDGQWVIEIGGDHIESLGVTDIVPEPESSDVTPDGVRYTFVQAEPDADLEATFSVTPDALWSIDGWLRLSNGSTVTIRQFFYP